MKNTQKGFTLIESLAVLSIFLIISLVTAFSFKPQSNMVDDQAFITQLKADLFYAQQYAISHQHEVTFNFIADQHIYYAYMRSDLPRIIERKYSSNIQVIPKSLPLYFKYLHDGNINRFGSFEIRTKEKSYQMTVLIGKGRFYVTEQ